MLGTWLAVAMVFTGIDLRVDPAVEAVDAAAVVSGLAIRSGDRAEGWAITIRPTESAERLDVRLRSRGGATLQRWVVLETDSEEERSRELASKLAFVIESHEDPETAPPPEPEPAPSPSRRGPSGVVAGGGSIGVGPPRDPDVSFGAALRGEAFLLRDHLVPVATVGWMGSRADGLGVDAVRFGAGLYGGGALARGIVWLGAGVVPRVARVTASERSTPSTWTSSTELAARLWVRVWWLAIGVRTGAELTLRPVRALGNEADVRWGPARFFVGLDLGAGVVCVTQRRVSILPERNWLMFVMTWSWLTMAFPSSSWPVTIRRTFKVMANPLWCPKFELRLSDLTACGQNGIRSGFSTAPRDRGADGYKSIPR